MVLSYSDDQEHQGKKELNSLLVAVSYSKSPVTVLFQEKKERGRENEKGPEK